MKLITIRLVAICKLLALAILFAGCTHVVRTITKPLSPVPRTTVIEKISKRSYLVDRSYLADKDALHFLVAGRHVWIFYDEYMIVKSASTEIKIPYKRYKPPGKCIPRHPRPCKNSPCLAVKRFNPSKNCAPRPIFSKGPGSTGRNWSKYSWKQNSRRGFWVLADRVVVTLGTMQYYYQYDGTFIERKKNEKDWDLKIEPYAKYKWRRVERKHGQTSKVYFKDLAFNAVSARFSGPWVAIIQKSTSPKNEYDYLLIHRATGKVQTRYQANSHLRTYDNGFYSRGIWYGETIIDLRDDDPQKYCYPFKGKKKCVLKPKMSPKEICRPFGRGKKCISKKRMAKIFDVIETDDFIVKELSGGVVEITYDKENYYTKTHHFPDEAFKSHLRDYLSIRKIWSNAKLRRDKAAVKRQ